MLQRSRQLQQLGQALDTKPVSLSSRRPVAPGDLQRHSASRTSFTDEHPLGSGTALLEDDGQTLAKERVERVRDDDRVRKRARLGKTGAMRAPWVFLGDGVSRSPWESTSRAPAGEQMNEP